MRNTLAAAAKDAVRGFAVVLPFAATMYAVTYREAESLARRLAAAERRNAELHALSVADRASIHRIQEDVMARLAAVERRAAADPRPGPPRPE